MISVVIVSFRSSAILVNCADSVLAQLSEFDELIVIENSGDKQLLQEPFVRDHRVSIKINPINQGYTVGCNQGLSLAGNDHVLLLNPDTVPQAGAFDQLKAHLSTKRSSVYCVELLNEDGSRQDYYRRFPSVRALLVMFFAPSGIQNHFSSYRHYTYFGELDKKSAFQQPPGAGLVVSKNHRLDEDFFVYGSDLQFCWEIFQKNHLPIEMLPAKFYHARGQGGTASSTELADALRVESAKAFALYYKKTGQNRRHVAWNLFYILFEIIGIIKVGHSAVQRKQKTRRLIAFVFSEPWLEKIT